MNHTLQYIDQHTTTKTNIQRQNEQRTRTKNGYSQPIYRPQSQLKGFRVRIDFAEKDFIELDQ